jgi:single-strand DNA-binding protein
MMNRVILVGRLTKDVDLRFTANGKAVASGTIAVNRTFKAEGQPDADFINFVIWNKAAENTANFTKKGSLVGIDGRIQTRTYDNKEGQKVYVTEVIADSVQFLDPKGAKGEQKQEKPQQNNTTPVNISDDDLPF